MFLSHYIMEYVGSAVLVSYVNRQKGELVIVGHTRLLNQARAWFLEITFMRMSVCVRVCVCVCPPPRLLKTIHVK